MKQTTHGNDSFRGLATQQKTNYFVQHPKDADVITLTPSVTVKHRKNPS